MRPRYNDGVLFLDEELMDGFRHRGIRQVELQRAGGLGVGRCGRVADHHQVGMERHQVVFRIPLEHRYAEAFEVGGHRGVDVLIGAGHFVAALLQHPGQRGHRRAADADQVDLFYWR